MKTIKSTNYNPDDYIIVNNQERSPKFFIDKMDKFCNDLNTNKKPKKPYTLNDILDRFRTKAEQYDVTELFINKKNFKKLVDVLFKSLPKSDQKKGAYIKLIKNIEKIKFPDDNFIVKMKATYRGVSRRVCTYDCCKSQVESGNGKPDRCIAHGGSNRCKHLNCKNSAVSGNGKPDRCKAHGGGDRCTYLDCKTSAVSGNGKKDRCVAHGGGDRCTYLDCKTSVQSGNGKKDRCIAHGGSNRCKHLDCKRAARSGNGKKDRCVAHGGGDRCTYLDCKTSAQSGNGKKDRCVAHGGGNICTYLDCKTSAQSGNGKKDRCIAHGGGNICPNCLNSQSLLNYKKLCRMCFKEAYPDDPKSKSMRNYTYHEKLVKTYFETKDYQFIHNKKIHQDEGLELTTDHKISYRIDFRKLINNTMICVEIDEHSGHYKTKDADIKRMKYFKDNYNCKFIWLRFMPDKDDGVEFEDKLCKLKEMIDYYVDNDVNDDMIVEYLYY